MKESYDVVIIGAGLAGLSAAVELEKFDLKALILEKEDRVGGRVKTDEVDGFKLDHGFQVYLDEYPEGKRLLDYGALKLQKFKPGAICFDRTHQFEVSDINRNKLALPRMAASPVGNFMDKIRLGNLSARLKRANLEEIFQRPEHTTMDYLKQKRFSDKIIKRFFQPFFAGIFLEPELKTSSRMFEFVFKMMAQGNVTIPQSGMEQIPKLLKLYLKRTEFRFHTEVKELRQNEIVLDGEENIQCDHIIVATEAENLMPQMRADNKWRSAATYYFAADESLFNTSIIGLNFMQNRLVNNLSVLSDVSSDYAPKGQHLVSVSLSHIPDKSVEDVSQDIKNELALCFGARVQGWRFLRNYHIRKALPALNNLKDDVSISETRIREGLYQAGDHILNASINAALKSGKMAAKEAVLQFDANKQ